MLELNVHIGRLSVFRALEQGSYKVFFERRELGRPDLVFIHVVTNNLRRTGNLDYVIGDV